MKATNLKAKNLLSPQASASSILAQQLAERRPLPKWAHALPSVVRILDTTGQALSSRQLAAAVGWGKTTVLKYVQPLRSLLATCRDACAMTARKLYEKLTGKREARCTRPDFAVVEKRLLEPGQTRHRLWTEYRTELPPDKAMSYPHFTRVMKASGVGQELTMRQQHEPGSAAFVDFSGKRPFYFDRTTGAKIHVELLVIVLAYSHYTFVEGLPSQKVVDWMAGATEMFRFFGGVPGRLVPDNLKSAVTKAGRVPEIQADYLELGEHYGVPIIPARARRPQDKGIVEASVKHVQQHLLPELAKQKFYSLEALNAAIKELMVAYNAKPFQKRPGSRLSEFEAVERAALRPLPSRPFVYFERVSKQKVPLDYHVRVLEHHYSVPHEFVGWDAEARASTNEVQVWIDGECVAKHPKGAPGGCTTDPEHQTEAHRAQALRTPEQVIAWGAGIGPCMEQVIQAQFRRHKVPLQGLQSAFAIQDLSRKATPEQLEAAAKEAVALRVFAASDVKRLVQALPKLAADPFPSAAPAEGAPQPLHRSRRAPRTARTPQRTPAVAQAVRS